MIHYTESAFSGQTVDIVRGTFAGKTYRVDDWWDRIAGASWTWGADEGIASCIVYGNRAIYEGTPPDDEVLYGVIDGRFEELVHVSELQ